MNYDAIVNGVIELLRQHGAERRGSIHQEPYKGDFFKLFATAYNAGLIESASQTNYLSADAPADIIASRAPEVLDGETWGDLRTFWQEWTYAWRQRDAT
jgi:hypothetical protein